MGTCFGRGRGFGNACKERVSKERVGIRTRKDWEEIGEGEEILFSTYCNPLSGDPGNGGRVQTETLFRHCNWILCCCVVLSRVREGMKGKRVAAHKYLAHLDELPRSRTHEKNCDCTACLQTFKKENFRDKNRLLGG